jgi:heme-binding NEAT domain protein
MLAITANAQTPPESDTTAAPQAEAPEATDVAPAVEEKKIDQFADAYIAVQEIQSQASQQLSATTDAQKADKVKQDAQNQMIQAVERSGLQIEEFNQIVQAMASDTSLRERVSERIDVRRRTS